VSTGTATKPTYYWGTGRRKTAVAKVRLFEGEPMVTVNGVAVEAYFSETKQHQDIYAPLIATGTKDRVTCVVQVLGGGKNGQAGAVVLGIARALKKYQPEFDQMLRAGGFLTRDSRMKERKKYGLHAARRGTQFSKR
jgi:small subunit ribosomal protein S9